MIYPTLTLHLDDKPHPYPTPPTPPITSNENNNNNNFFNKKLISILMGRGFHQKKAALISALDKRNLWATRNAVLCVAQDIVRCIIRQEQLGITQKF